MSSTVTRRYRPAVDRVPAGVVAGMNRACLPAAEQDGVLFMTGMRIHRLRRVRHWAPVLRAMTRMLTSQAKDPDSGVLDTRTWVSGRVLMVMQHWRSAEELGAFASDPDHPHAAAMRDFNRRVAGSGDVGIWHETYAVSGEATEALYGNMPTFGLAKAYGSVDLGAAAGAVTARVHGSAGDRTLGQDA
ncbi:DUF4188 domain-containing protein [Nocardioidaceae bacterium]|nr:DUF4188 domain-containing protein [Nocardioidaceae bacterium]